MKHAWPIQWFLFVLAAATAVPLCVYVGAILVRELNDAEAQAQQLAVTVASGAAVRVRADIARVEALARTMAQRPLVRALDPEHCDPLFGELLQLFPAHLNVSLVDLERRFVCSALPPVPDAVLPLHAALPAAFSGRFGMSDALLGVLPAKLMVSAAYPVRDGAGRIAGALTLPVDLAAFDLVDKSLSVPAGTVVRVTDGAGVIVASSLAGDPLLGHVGQGARLSDGVERIYADARVGVNEWRAYAGIAVAALHERARRRAALGALAAVGTLAISLLAAALVARRIVSPMRRIQHAMDEIAQGKHRHALPGGPREIRSLAENFNRMLDARLLAQRFMRENEARLRLAVSASGIGLWDWDVQRNSLYLSAEWKRQLGYAPDELAERYSEWEARLHPDERSQVLEHLAEFMKSDRSHFECDYRLRHADGSYRWVHSLAEVTRSPEGSPLRMIGTHIDITARKTMERDLRYAVAQLRGLSSRLVMVEENERRLIGRELHDRVGASLAALHIGLSMLGEKIARGEVATAHPLVQDALEVLSVTSAEIRSIIADLRPPVLDDFGIYAALRAHAAAAAARLGIEVSVSLSDALPRPPPAIETTLFRIAQEALTNMAKHAGAKRFDVSAVAREGRIELSISDDGVGFDPAAAASVGQGMRTMRERADSIGANFEVESAPGAGTRIRVSVEL